MKTCVLALTAISAATVASANQPDISALITDTVGYVNLAPGVVILEGDEFGTYVCQFDASDEAFEAYRANGDLGDLSVGYACIPIEEFEK